MQPETDTKECRRCGEVKATGEFYIQRKDKFGNPQYRGECKKCKGADQMDRRHKRLGDKPHSTKPRNPIVDGRKLCPHCGAMKAISEFYGSQETRIHSWCKECADSRIPRKYSNKRIVTPEQLGGRPRTQRDYYLMVTYSITSTMYDDMLADQNGICAICGSVPGKRRLSVDHDHDKHIVRGLLCSECNLGLGTFRDNPIILSRAITYLQRPTVTPEIMRLDLLPMRDIGRACFTTDFAAYSREYQLLKYYSLSLAAYDHVLEMQGGVCAICGDSPPSGRPDLFVDHDHNSKNVRGLLCVNCNAGIGRFGERNDLLIRAIDYLQSSTSEPK